MNQLPKPNRIIINPHRDGFIPQVFIEGTWYGLDWDSAFSSYSLNNSPAMQDKYCTKPTLSEAHTVLTKYLSNFDCHQLPAWP